MMLRRDGGGEFEIDRLLRKVFDPIRRDIDRLTVLRELLGPATQAFRAGDTVKSLRMGYGRIVGIYGKEALVQWDTGERTRVLLSSLGRRP